MTIYIYIYSVFCMKVTSGRVNNVDSMTCMYTLRHSALRIYMFMYAVYMLQFRIIYRNSGFCFFFRVYVTLLACLIFFVISSNQSVVVSQSRSICCLLPSIVVTANIRYMIIKSDTSFIPTFGHFIIHFVRLPEIHPYK